MQKKLPGFKLYFSILFTSHSSPSFPLLPLFFAFAKHLPEFMAKFYLNCNIIAHHAMHFWKFNFIEF